MLFYIVLWLLPGIGFAYLVSKRLKTFSELKPRAIDLVLIGLLINMTVAIIFVVLPKSLAQVLRMAYLLLGAVLFVYMLIRMRKVKKTVEANWVILPIILVFLSLAVNMHFTSQLIFPSFTDSITHYRYIDQLLHWRDSNQSLTQFLGELRFYHYGFYAIVAEVHQLTGYAITEIMLLVSMCLVVLAPFTVVLPLQALGIDRKIQHYAMAITALVFVFPGHALNWGKFPAILSSVLLALPLSLIFFVARKSSAKKHWQTYAIGLGCFVLLGVSHWRSVILLIALSLVALLYFRVLKERIHIALLVPIVMGASYFLFQDKGRFNLSTYQVIFWSFLFVSTVGLMLYRSIKKEANPLSLAALIYLSLRLLVAIPAGTIPRQYGSPIDMPYFRIVLYIVGGLFVGILFAEMKKLKPFLIRRFDFQKLLIADVWILICVALMLFAIPFQKKWQPSTTYILVHEQQKEMIDWALSTYEGKNLKIMLEGIREPDYIEYADAGGWLAVMAGFEPVFSTQNVDLNNRKVHAKICSEGIDLIFMDFTRTVIFNNKVFLNPDLYESLYETEDLALIGAICED